MKKSRLSFEKVVQNCWIVVNKLWTNQNYIYWTNHKETGLISIVSKPILIVVVVVIDGVFVKKMLGPKKFV